MLVGYARVSKSDDNLKLQKDSLIAANVLIDKIYEEYAIGKSEDRPELKQCLQSLRDGEDTLVVWKLDRLGKNLKHLIEIVQELEQRKIGLKVLTGKGSCLEINTDSGEVVFAIFAALSEYQSEIIKETTITGLKAAKARGRKGGRKFTMTKTKLIMARHALQNRDTKITDLCEELKISRYTLYRYFSPEGEFRDYAHKLLSL